ncbi:type II secretion system protein N [Marinobacteraceae bacterium S3BR75-40.1]
MRDSVQKNGMTADERITNPWPGRIAFLLLVGLIVNLAWLGGLASWRFWQVPVEIPPIYQGQGSAAAGGVTKPALALSDLDLFGAMNSQDAVPDVISKKAPETRLRLSLLGVMVAERPEESGAIVAEGREDAGYYRVGQDLPGGAKLVEVEPKRILIRRAGQIESLTFPEEGSEGVQTVAATEETFDSPEAFAEAATERLQEDPDQALGTVGLQPAPSGTGYVYDGSNPMLSAMNLQQGDVILSINNYPLGDIAQDRQMLQQWTQEDELTVEVERDGTRFTFTYPMP